MRKIEICKKYLDPKNTKKTSLTYFITVDETPSFGDGGTLENYGVGIRLEPDEEEMVRCITMESEKIERLVDLLATNHVCPITLRDVIDDTLGVDGFL